MLLLLLLLLLMMMMMYAGECCYEYELEPVGEVGITYEQMRALIDSLLLQSSADS